MKKRIKLIDRILPKYSKGEEIFNMTSHILGTILGLVALVMCIVFASLNRNVYGIVSGAIYGVTMIILYTMSSVYHGLSPKLYSKRVFQVLDHCSIFLLIAGSYTPFSLSLIRSSDPLAGWVIFGIIWFFAILGIILNAIDIKKFKIFSMICYILMGWCIIFKIKLLIELLSVSGFILLLLGGISYTVGAIIYAAAKKHKYSHSIFHLFILIRKYTTFLMYINELYVKIKGRLYKNIKFFYFIKKYCNFKINMVLLKMIFNKKEEEEKNEKNSFNYFTCYFNNRRGYRNYSCI